MNEQNQQKEIKKLILCQLKLYAIQESHCTSKIIFLKYIRGGFRGGDGGD